MNSGETHPEAWLSANFNGEIPKPGLDRIKKAIKLFNLDFSAKSIVTIGGTNGKGQTSREIYRRSLGEKRVALWTSPHLIRVNERFAKNGEFISDKALLNLFETTSNRLLAGQLSLSYYEFLFLCFLQFSDDCELLALEVGLGGRLDAVNALNPDFVIVTSISRDHQEYLGKRYDGILKEKFQLGRRDRPLVSAFELSYLRRLGKEEAKKLGAKYHDLFESGELNSDHTFSERNIALAAHALKYLFGRVPKAKLEDGPLIEFRFKKNSKVAACHGLAAHNPDGVRKGIHFLKDDKYTKYYKLTLMSFSERDFKDALAMIETVKAWALEFRNAAPALVGFDHPKAMKRDKLKRLAEKANIKFFNDSKDIFSEGPILVLGSNYFIGFLAENSSFTRR